MAAKRKIANPNSRPLTAILNNGHEPEPIKQADPPVTLSTEKWAEVIGILTQGTQVILSQLAMQKDGLPQVAQLSATASNLIEEIKQQLPQP